MSRRIFEVVSLLALASAGGVAYGESSAGGEPIWARDGASLAMDCMVDAPTTARSAHGDASVTVACHAQGQADETLRIHYKKEGGADLELIVPLAELNGGHWRPQEILWSPDGLAFLINGSENAYAGSDFFLFRVEGNALVRQTITPAAQSDMVDRLARCWPYIREIVGARPRFNMSAISWRDDSLAVFAEVPCNSTFENSMCSVYGYEMNARSGAITKVLSAGEVRRDWRAQMKWNMTEPDLPTCDPHTGKVQER